MSYTPGPWRAVKAGDDYQIVYNDYGNWLAEVWHDDDELSDRAQTLSDARLIAAAPDLLEALKTAMTWIKNWDPSFVYDEEWPEDDAKIRYAIAKAEGTTS